VSSLAGPLLLVAGLVLVLSGADLFFKGLLATAARFRASPYVLTVVVSGFELENLAAGIALDVKGLGNGAAGTFLGGTTFLALAVPGLAAVVSPIRTRMPLPVLAWTAAAPLPVFGLGVDGDLSRIDGALLVAWFAVALTGIARSGRHLLGSPTTEWRRYPVGRMLAGLALISGAGELLGEGLRRVVRHFDVSATLLGNTTLAPAVEVEEVARVAVPAARGRGEVALGNVFGTIAHFSAFNAGVIALVRPIQLDEATRDLHLPIAGASALMLAALVAWRRGLHRGDGVGLLLIYAVYVAAAVAKG
jgi:cation:H+ antiporter